MLLKSVVTMKVLDKCKQDYDFPVLDENKNETGRNKGTNYLVTLKYEENPSQNVKLPKDRIDIYDACAIGKDVNFIFEFETEPKAYVKDGKAVINFMHVPRIVDIVPAK